MIYVLGCGKAKNNYVSPAYKLYRGGYFKMNLAYCQSIGATLTTTYIVSALYGLIKASKYISPYDIRLGEAGSVTTEQVQAQAQALGLHRHTRVLAMASKDYIALLGNVFDDVIVPLKGLSIGRSMSWASKNKGRRPWEPPVK